MKLRFAPQAIRGLDEISAYLRPRNPYAAQRVRDSILDSLKILNQFPYAGRKQTVDTVRKLITRKYRYLVYYSVDESHQEVVVLAIQHPARARDYHDA